MTTQPQDTSDPRSEEQPEVPRDGVEVQRREDGQPIDDEDDDSSHPAGAKIHSRRRGEFDDKPRDLKR